MINYIIKSSMVNNIWFTLHAGNTNKMDNKTSIMMDHISLCEKRSKNKKSICSKCYSRKLSTYRRHSSMKKYMEHNTNTLKTTINISDIPKINTVDNTLRFNSTGDNEEINEVLNIFKISKKNKHLKCALWTKNHSLYKNVLNTNNPPKNLNLIYSMNNINNLNFIIPNKFTKSFYVYSNEDILNEAFEKAKSEDFNVMKCQKKCIECNVCYKNQQKQIIMELMR